LGYVEGRQVVAPAALITQFFSRFRTHFKRSQYVISGKRMEARINADSALNQHVPGVGAI